MFFFCIKQYTFLVAENPKFPFIIKKCIFRYFDVLKIEMYLLICDKDQYNEFSYGPNDKIWSMIDKKEDWNKIAEYIQVK